MTLNVLISHSHAERPLAEAWKALLNAISSGMITAWYSSDTSASGGMRIGAEWRETLRDQINDSPFVIALLSPASRDRPWILWECGVMNGLAQARVSGDGRQAAAIIPVVYSMPPSELENPLSSFQVYVGDNRNTVTEVCLRLAKEAGLPAPQPQLWGPVLDSYMSRIVAHRPHRARTLDDIMLWRTRFEQAIRSGRAGEVYGLRQQMYITFGAEFKPTSIQLHDLLSTVMLETGHFPEAIKEADHGLSLDSSDITLLHRKILALAELPDINSALDTAKKLLASEPALATNTEIAGLVGRIYRDRYRTSMSPEDLRAARNAYQAAAQANSSDYYCALNAAELALVAGDKDSAKRFFEQALSNARTAQELLPGSFWADFTVGQILLFRGDAKAALAEYQRGLGRQPAPEDRHRQSALAGALRMAEPSGAPTEIQQRLRELLTKVPAQGIPG